MGQVAAGSGISAVGSNSSSTVAWHVMLGEQHPYVLFLSMGPRFPEDLPTLTLQSFRCAWRLRACWIDRGTLCAWGLHGRTGCTPGSRALLSPFLPRPNPAFGQVNTCLSLLFMMLLWCRAPGPEGTTSYSQFPWSPR